LLINSQNPRSLMFQLESLSEHLRQLPPFKIGRGIKEEGKLILKAYADLNLTEMKDLVEETEGERLGLEVLSAGIAKLLAQASEHINNTYFAHALKRQQLTGAEEAV